MKMSTVTAYAVNAVDGTNGAVLGSVATDAAGAFNITISPHAGPVRLTASGGTFVSEMDGGTISAPADISVLLSDGGTSLTGLSINPLTEFINAIVLAKFAAGSTTVPAALAGATSSIQTACSLSSDPATLAPDYSLASQTAGTDAAKMGLIVGAIINEDQSLCPAAPGQLVKALAADISDGRFDGQQPTGSGSSPIAYCGGNLAAIAGTTEFSDALSGLGQLQLVSQAFAFGGSYGPMGNALPASVTPALVAPAAIAIETAIAVNNFTFVPLTNTFAPSGGVASMNHAREGATATLLRNGKVLIAGGANFDLADVGSRILDSTELYDPVTNTFAPAASTATMPLPHWNHTATLLPNGKVLIAGGELLVEVVGGGLDFFLPVPLNATELYDPASNTFTAGPDMNAAYDHATATLLPNGKVLITSSSVLGTSTELYDWVTNTFAAPADTAKTATARAFDTATLLPNSKVLVAGGVGPGPDNTLLTLGDSEIYDPLTNSFSPGPSMNTARSSAAAAPAVDGTVVIAGGSGSDGLTLSSTETYDWKTNSFAAVADTVDMSRARRGITLTPLPNSLILVAGGDLSAGAPVDLYPFTAPGFIFLHPLMNIGRVSATATLLPNGKVLVAGGDSILSELSVSELFTP